MERPAINLLNIPCPSCKRQDKTRDDFDFPETMASWDHCGCDFMKEDGEIVLDPENL